MKAKKDGSLDSTLTGVGSAFKVLGGVAAAAVGTGIATPLVAAGASLGAFAAVAYPTLNKIKTALTSTGAAGQKAWAALDPAQKDIARNIQGLQQQFQGLEKSLTPLIDKVVGLAVKMGHDLMPAFGALAKAGGTVLDAVLKPMDKLFQSDFFHGFIRQMSHLAEQVAPILGRELVKVAKALFQLMEAVGPSGPKLIKAVGDALVAIVRIATPILKFLADVIAKMAATKAGAAVLAGALTALGFAWLAGFGPVGWAIGLLAGLAVAFKVAWDHSQTFREVMANVFNDFAQIVLANVKTVIGIIQGLGDAIFNVVDGIVHAMRIAADAVGLHFLDGVDNGLSKAKGSFDNFMNNTTRTMNGWSKWLGNLPMVVHLKGDITDAQKKIAEDKRMLADKSLTATKRARLEADISPELAAIRRARAALAAIDGSSATTYIYTSYVSPAGGKKPLASGGITGAAWGGVQSGLTMVGEHGAELVKLPPGSYVNSNPDTQRIMSQGGGWGGQRPQITIRFGTAGLPGSLDAALMKWLRERIRVEGGDVQLVLGP